MRFKNLKYIQIGKHNPLNYSVFRREIRQVFNAGIYSNSGSKVKKFENDIKIRWGLGEVNLVTNGTLAIEIALKLLARKSERANAKYVLTTPFTHASTIIAVKNAGYSPIFIDIEGEFLTLDPEKLSQFLLKNTSMIDQILCILPVHPFNNCCDIDSIKRISTQYSIPVIYDAAHSIGCEYNSNSILNSGLMSCVSLHATKSLSSGEGGLVVVNDEELFGEVNMHRNFGITVDGTIRFFGTNGKVSEISACTGLASLKNFDKYSRLKQRISNYYKYFLSEGGLEGIPIRKGYIPNYNYFPLILKNQTIANSVIQNLLKNQIGYRKYFSPSLDTLFTNSNSNCPISNSIANRIICLPTNFDLTKADVKRISKVVTGALI
jgi:dTDP-4-amino-4,6-dideoxygalactose transaminase